MRHSVALIAWWGFLACLGYLVLMGAFTGIMFVVAALENQLRAREDLLEDFETLAASPFTVPVSVLAPAYNEETSVVASVRSLLAQEFPEFEVIVMSDGSGDATLQRLRDAFGLRPIVADVRPLLPAPRIRQLYRSSREPRLVVADMEHGGKAAALNCALNLARYRYICTVDSDTVYHPEALLKGMRLATQDPATVVGVTSRVEVSSQPALSAIQPADARVERHPLLVYQLFDYLRAFVGARLAWSRGNYMLCSVGAFAIWRRDLVLELGGFSPAFTCEDIEFTFRVHEHLRAMGTPYRIHSLSDPVGFTEGPTSVRRLVTQRARWQRVIMETVWHYRHMLFRRRYGTVGFLGLPYYVLGEVCAPFFQALSLLLVPITLATGTMQWPEFVRGIAIIAIASGLFTAAALFIQERTQRQMSTGQLVLMLAMAPLDLVLYRPVIAYAQCQGAVGFLRGDRAWHKYERNAAARYEVPDVTHTDS